MSDLEQLPYLIGLVIEDLGRHANRGHRRALMSIGRDRQKRCEVVTDLAERLKGERPGLAPAVARLLATYADEDGLLDEQGNIQLPARSERQVIDLWVERCAADLEESEPDDIRVAIVANVLDGCIVVRTDLEAPRRAPGDDKGLGTASDQELAVAGEMAKLMSWLNALDADFPRWEELLEFSEKISRIARERIAQHDQRVKLRTALASLGPLALELGYLEIPWHGWPEALCAATDIAATTDLLNRLAGLVQKHAAIRARPVASRSEERALQHERDAVVRQVDALVAVLSAVFSPGAGAAPPAANAEPAAPDSVKVAEAVPAPPSIPDAPGAPPSVPEGELEHHEAQHPAEVPEAAPAPAAAVVPVSDGSSAGSRGTSLLESTRSGPVRVESPADLTIGHGPAPDSQPVSSSIAPSPRAAQWPEHLESLHEFLDRVWIGPDGARSQVPWRDHAFVSDLQAAFAAAASATPPTFAYLWIVADAAAHVGSTSLPSPRDVGHMATVWTLGSTAPQLRDQDRAREITAAYDEANLDRSLRWRVKVLLESISPSIEAPLLQGTIEDVVGALDLDSGDLRDVLVELITTGLTVVPVQGVG